MSMNANSDMTFLRWQCIGFCRRHRLKPKKGKLEQTIHWWLWMDIKCFFYDCFAFSVIKKASFSARMWLCVFIGNQKIMWIFDSIHAFHMPTLPQLAHLTHNFHWKIFSFSNEKNAFNRMSIFFEESCISYLNLICSLCSHVSIVRLCFSLWNECNDTIEFSSVFCYSICFSFSFCFDMIDLDLWLRLIFMRIA